MVAANLQAAGERARLCHLLTHDQADSVPCHAPDLWRTSWEEGVGPMLWHTMQRQGAADARMRAFFRAPLRRHLLLCMQQQHAAQAIAAAFHDAGLAFVFLRGLSLAPLYDPPNLRPQHDIDILLAAENVPRAKECLERLGYASVPLHPMLFARGEVMVDLHTEPLGAERIHSWRLLTPIGAQDFLSTPTLTPELWLPYLCFHAMKHSFSRLIWLLDIALLARRVGRQDTWLQVEKGIKRYRLSRPCYYALAYADRHLDARVPQALLERLAPRMGRRERRLFDRFMAHETVPFLAERVFARMLPPVRRPAFWWETCVPAKDVRRQLAAMQGDGWRGFLRQRLGLLTRLLRSS